MLDWLFEYIKLREQRKILKEDIKTYQNKVKSALSIYDYNKAKQLQVIVDEKTKELLDTYNI